ncbi:MAG: DNA-processing protein DprA, partial [Planctomycetota bacterium]
MESTRENSKDIAKWLKLTRSEGVGSVTFANLLKHFRSVDRILGASARELEKVDGIGYKTAEKIASSAHKYDPQKELELAQKLGVWIINIKDRRYPTLLKRIYDPPPVIYIRGTLSSADNLSIAIVGSRRCSLYGQEQASKFAHFLASIGFTVCSGMARGIDSAAHQGALSAEGRTIAVQGCGLAKVFPPENKELFEKITASGACISELPLEYEPLSENFPPRNRIIAGLAMGTIVIEAGLRSGALITAQSALSNNREVMAVPGKIDSPVSRGTNLLIKQGARLIDSVEDIVDALGYITEKLKDHVSTAVQQAEDSVSTQLLQNVDIKLSSDEQKIFD